MRRAVGVEMGDYQVTVKLRNNRILSRMKERGFANFRALADAAGINYNVLSALVTMRCRARRLDGEWPKYVMALSAALACEPEELFTERQAAGGARSLVAVATEEQIERLSDLADDVPAIEGPERALARKLLSEDVVAALCDLTPREREVIERRFGLNGREEETFKQIGDDFHRSNALIRSIETKALSRLRAKAAEKGLAAWAVDPSIKRDGQSNRFVANAHGIDLK